MVQMCGICININPYGANVPSKEIIRNFIMIVIVREVTPFPLYSYVVEAAIQFVCFA